MKKFSMVQVLFIIICLLTCKIVCAQDYVVTLQNDTIEGKVKMLNFGAQQKLQVAEEGKKKKTYDLLQVRAFRLDDEIYHTVRTTQGYSFMKLLQGGYLSLYAFQPPNQVNWDGRYLIKRDGSGLEVPNLGFKKRLTAYLEDCTDISSKVDVGDYNRNDLDKIINEYNACILAKTQKRNEEIKVSEEKIEKINYWNELETAIANKPDFEGKSDAKEMINEVKLKIKRSEKVPNFLIDGLKNALKDQTDLTDILTKALAELN